MNSSKNKLKV